MSEDIFEQVDPATLKRLDLPKTSSSPQGLDNVILPKLLNLSYTTNDLAASLHLMDSRPATAWGAGTTATFTAPPGSRYIIFSMRFTLVSSATVGNRTVQVDRLRKGGFAIDRFISGTNAASTTVTYGINSAAAGNDNTHVQISYPLRLEAEWFMQVRDSSSIDVNDTVAWEIEYMAVVN